MRNIWIAVVALVGIGLAFFLFQRPDTGAVATNPDNTRPLDFQAADEGTVHNPDVLTEAKTKRPRQGRKEGTERLLEIRSKPDAVYAGKLIAPWTAVRFTLMKEYSDDAEATEIADELRPILTVLQQGRRDPTREAPLADTQAKLDELAERIRGTDLIQNETISEALRRHAVTIDEFADAAANEAANAGGTEEDSE